LFFSFHASIGFSFQGDKFTVQAEAVEDGRRGGGIEEGAPFGGNEVGGDDGGTALGALGDDLEEGVGLVPGGDGIADFIDAKDGDPGVVIDEGVDIFGPGEAGLEVEEADEGGLDALQEGLVTEGGPRDRGRRRYGFCPRRQGR